MDDDGETKGKKDQSWAAMCDESDSDDDGNQANAVNEELNTINIRDPSQKSYESSIQLDVSNNGPPYRAYVGNFEYTVSEKDIEDFFANGNCKVKQVHLIRDPPTKKSKGCANGNFR